MYSQVVVMWALSEALLQSVFIVYCVGRCVYSQDMVMGALSEALL